MYGTLYVNAWIGVHEGCEMTYDVGGSGEAQLTIRGKGLPFELYFQAEALRRFVGLGTRALVEMDAIAEQEQARRVGPAKAAERAA